MADLKLLPYPPDLAADQQEQLINTVTDWLIAHGFFAPRKSGTDKTQPTIRVPSSLSLIPVTLFPSLFPRTCFHDAIEIQPEFNKLYAAVAADEDWLSAVIQDEFADSDEFIKKLWSVHLAVKSEGYVQARPPPGPVRMSAQTDGSGKDTTITLARSDYLLSTDQLENSRPLTIKQVEFNGISSFGGSAHSIAELHSHLYNIGMSQPSQGLNADQSSFPPNPSLKGLCAGLLAAHTIYGDPKSGCATKIGILLIAQPVEWNIYEHRRIQYFLWSQDPAVPIYSLPLSSVLDKTTVTDSRHLLYTPNPEAETIEISVVFFRGGHDAEDYTSAIEWEARRHLERSFAIKCPSILTQIACTKKVQQLLAKDSNLKRFVSDASSLRLKETFMEMYPLGAQTADGQKGRQLALDPKSACGYVLKPQRECGGHNIYGEAIPAYLNTLPESQWRSYILMRLIKPPCLRNVILRNGEPATESIINELGVYGTCIWRATRQANNLDIMYNGNAGWLVRTKNRAHAEGGIGAGFGSFDSLFLVDD